ncbi:MAG: carboxypeptidase-like regulatory domain-containing protein [Thermoplasmatota archaeon]
MFTKALKKGLVCGIVVLFLGMSIIPIVGSQQFFIDSSNYSSMNIVHSIKNSETTTYHGTLSGYVTDSDMNPIEGARIRVYFHDTYREDFSDSTGYY